MKKPWILSIIITLLLLIVLFIGIWIGQYRVSEPVRKIIIAYQKSETLGSLLATEQRAGISQAYSDPNIALEELDNISWDVPKDFTPFVGNAPLPGAHNNALINSFQFRSANEVPFPKSTTTYRIILTGGSTAFGTGAPSQEETIGGFLGGLLNSQLSAKTNKSYEVLTFATPAWASTNERIAIENRISELEPDLVISISGNNDIHWGWRGRNILWFRTYSDEFFFILINKAYEIAGYPPLPDITQIDSGHVAASMVTNRLIKNVTLSAFALNLQNIPYYYFLQPTIALTNKPLTVREAKIFSDPAEKDYYIECLKSFDKQLSGINLDNFHYFNLSSVFDNQGASDEIYIDRSHFGDKGYKIIADAIYTQIRSLIQP